MSFSPRSTPPLASPQPLPQSLSFSSLSSNLPLPTTSPTSSSLSSPTTLSKKRLRPHSTSNLRERRSDADSTDAPPPLPAAERPSPPSSTSTSSIPGQSEQQRASPPSSSTSFASTKRRAVSDTSLASLDRTGEERPGSLQTLLAESSGDDDDEEEEEEEEEGEEDEEEEDEKSPPRAQAGALTPLSSMANAAAASSALSPLASPLPSPPHVVPHSHPSLADSPSEFSSQLFVIYMPKANFKRFVISSLNTTIIRAPKGEKQPVPRMNFPSLHTARPGISPLLPPGMSRSSSPSSSSSSSGHPPASPPSADEFTYNVSMEDVLSCLEAHGVRYNPQFMWMDLSDFGARFVQQMMGDSAATGAAKHSADDGQAKSSDRYGGLWYNVVHKSHLVANHFAHPFLGEGYAVVVTLDLLDSNKDQTTVSPLQMEQSQTQTITVANDTLYKATKNINEGGITAHPALLTSTSNPPSAALAPLSPFVTAAHAAAAPAEATSTSSSSSRRKVRPVESIGEMLDRIGEYQRIRSQVKSKNKACEKLGYSKGTINAYREKVKQALQLGIDLNMIRKTKYRDFKRVLAAAHQQQQSGGGGQHNTGNSSGSGGGNSARDKSGKRDEGLKQKRSNSFGDLGIALMARQDAKNGSKKGKGDRRHSRDEERKKSDDDDDDSDDGQPDNDDGQHQQQQLPADSPVQHYPRSHQHRGRDASPSMAASALSASTSSPKQVTHHLQPMASLVPQTGFSPPPQRGSLGTQVTYLQATPHATFTTGLPPGTTYVLNPTPIGNAQQMTTTFAPQYVQGTGYAGTSYGTVYATTGGGVYTTATAAQPQGVRPQSGPPTYQVVSNGTVQMAQNVQQSAQTPFPTSMRYL